MEFLGKVEPDVEKMNEMYSWGFDAMELYLNREILEQNSVSEIVSTCEQAEIEVEAVHTPHVDVTKPIKKYYQQTDEIANALEAILVLDSNPMSTRYMHNVYTPEEIISDQFGYENDPSVSGYYLLNYHLAEMELPLVLDTAHSHMSDENILPTVEKAIANYKEQIPLVHLADGDILDDGHDFGDGTVPLRKVLQILEVYDYDGFVTLETDTSAQEAALNYIT